jgi:LL-diaminopimelate aminotransferase
MAKLNPCFSRLKNAYIFAIIDKKLIELKKSLPSTDLINLSIGDITLPLAPSIVKAIQEATQEMGTMEGIKGYSPTYGYDFLRSAIAKQEYANYSILPEEIYISDGTNSDAVHIQELMHPSSTIAIPDPTYPAYFNSSVIGGKKKIVSLPCLPENQFVPLPPQEHCNMIYLCSPNNPTGTAMTRKDLTNWIAYALEHEAILLIDSAYAAFITSENVPKSIYEISGSKECAIEFKSFSKSAGFTGLRCAYSVIPHTVMGSLKRKRHSLYKLWEKRQDIKFNGVAYPIQRGAAASLSSSGLQETQKQVHFYLSLAKRLKEGLEKLGQTCWGAKDSPYIWWKTPNGTSSWQFFDHLLNTCQLIALPGIGFGPCGEGYIRLSAFSSEDKISLALERINNKVI